MPATLIVTLCLFLEKNRNKFRTNGKSKINEYD